MKELSCGFIVRMDGKYLACHCSGRKYDEACYDIPKGHIEEGETPFEAAKRELLEETGIDLDDPGLKYKVTELGQMRYIKTKDLHLFLLDIEEYTKEMTCSTTYNFQGWDVPEIDAYAWTKDISLFFHSLQKIFALLIAEQKI